MIFQETKIPGALVIEPELHGDHRGFFARTWCRQEFERRGLNANLSQCSISFNHTKGTLRGLHYQAAPHQEIKLVRVTQGAIYDVILDLRTNSPTYKKWFAIELTALNHRLLYIPEGLAHGFLTLANDTEICYQIAGSYEPGSASGVRWNDPAFGITWPMQPQIISLRDRGYPDFLC